MKISFLTTSSLATNPRLVKEVLLAQDQFDKVEVISFSFGNWSNELDDKIKLQFKSNVKVIELPASKQSFFVWFTSTLLERLAKKLFYFNNKSLILTSLASNKRTSLLLYYIRKHNLLIGSSIIISHNLGALFPAFYFTSLYNIPFAFDVEDYHPGEVIHQDAVNEKKRREILMQLVLPHAAYVTAASTLIAREVENLCKVPVITINNSFYSKEFELPAAAGINFGQKLKLVWFSQHINYGRGLELLFSALDSVCDHVTLTLIGNLNSNFAKEWLQDITYVKVIAPLQQDILHKELSKHDIGLALDLSSTDFNRDIALTNKIFAYKQAGLYVLATDTKAQVDFMNQFKDEGYVCEQTSESISSGIAYMLEHVERIRAEKTNRLNKAREIAFEAEEEKLKALWQKATI
jgi:hypothetical protein